MIQGTASNDTRAAMAAHAYLLVLHDPKTGKAAASLQFPVGPQLIRRTQTARVSAQQGVRGWAVIEQGLAHPVWEIDLTFGWGLKPAGAAPLDGRQAYFKLKSILETYLEENQKRSLRGDQILELHFHDWYHADHWQVVPQGLPTATHRKDRQGLIEHPIALLGVREIARAEVPPRAPAPQRRTSDGEVLPPREPLSEARAGQLLTPIDAEEVELGEADLRGYALEVPALAARFTLSPPSPLNAALVAADVAAVAADTADLKAKLDAPPPASGDIQWTYTRGGDLVRRTEVAHNRAWALGVVAKGDEAAAAAAATYGAQAAFFTGWWPALRGKLEGLVGAAEEAFDLVQALWDNVQMIDQTGALSWVDRTLAEVDRWYGVGLYPIAQRVARLAKDFEEFYADASRYVADDFDYLVVIPAVLETFADQAGVMEVLAPRRELMVAQAALVRQLPEAADYPVALMPLRGGYRTLALQYLNDAERWEEIAALNGPEPAPGATVRLPGTAPNPERDERNFYGGDWAWTRVDEGGDLVVAGEDLKELLGLEALESEVNLRMITPYGDLPEHPRYGLPLDYLGSPALPKAQQLMLAALQTLLDDPRIAEVGLPGGRVDARGIAHQSIVITPRPPSAG